MFRKYRRFLKGLSTNWVGTAGVVLTTSAFVLFIFMEALRLLGIVTNAYVGLISYMVLPGLFLLGLALIPVGWWIYRKGTGRSTAELLSERFDPEILQPKATGSRLVATIAVLTLVNVLFLGAGGARMLHFMDEPVFCGTACHRVMHPEWITYQDSPHARVKCVGCHVGEGAEALVDAKLNGLWQIVSATFDLYERPIPTPVHQLRPARETCEKCHWPDKFHGSRVKTFPRFGFDRESTPSYTALSLKIGSGTGEQRGEIHWHVAEANEVRYASRNDERETMLWVEVRKGDDFWRFTNRKIEQEETGAVRTMDCVDCHNRATHVYEDPERAIDERIHRGELDLSIPYLKREALAALTSGYADTAAATAGIRNALTGVYARRFRAETAALQESIEDAVGVLQALYRRNVHPLMNVSWNPYPDHRGHRGGSGCFRCHNPDLVDAYGEPIPYDCTLCHSFLSYDSSAPFAFLEAPDSTSADFSMHAYLRDEFLRSASR
jgi:hypothetical protein